MAAVRTQALPPLPALVGIRGASGAGKDTLGAVICRARPEYTTQRFAGALREAASKITGIPADRMLTALDKAAPVPGRAYPVWDLANRISLAASHVTGADVPIAASFAILGVLTGVTYGRVVPCCPEPVRLQPMTVGRLLQLLGVEGFRAAFGPTVWADALLRPWEAAGRPPTVAPDMRFLEESAGVRAAGGLVVLVRRGAAAAAAAATAGAAATATGRGAAHASEHALDAAHAPEHALDAAHAPEHALDAEPADITLDNDGTVEELAASFWAAVAARAAD